MDKEEIREKMSKFPECFINHNLEDSHDFLEALIAKDGTSEEHLEKLCESLGFMVAHPCLVEYYAALKENDVDHGQRMMKAATWALAQLYYAVRDEMRPAVLRGMFVLVRTMAGDVSGAEITKYILSIVEAADGPEAEDS